MRRPEVPSVLRLLVVAVVLAGVAWALLVPAWQVPDEDAHFAYVQSIAENGQRPADDGRPAQEGAKSTEQDLAERMSGFLDSAQRIEARPAWSAGAEDRWRALDAALPAAASDDGGGANPAGANPPGYYLYAAVPYLLASAGDVLDRLYLMRLWGLPLLALFAASGWLLAGELLGCDRPAQLLAGAVCGLAPMASAVSVAVTPDALVLPLWGLALWLCARVLRRGRARRDVLALLGVTLAALLVKPVSVALLPGVAWALAGGRVPLRLLAGFAVAAGIAALLVVPGGPRRTLSYLWQFYVPVDAGSAPIALLPPWPLRDVWLEGTVGAFGWLEVRFPWPVYALAALLAAVVVVVAARRLEWRRDAPVVVGLALPALALLAGLHLTEAWFLVRQDDAFTQGRYLLPLLPLAGVAAGAALRAVPARGREPALGAALGLLAALQLASLAIVAARFYA